MKLNIDHLTSVSGWVLNSPSAITTITDSQYIAGLNDTALMITFSQNDSIRTAIKTFSSPIDVSECESLILNIWSQRYGANKAYVKAADYAYKIKLNDTAEFYLPIRNSFCDVTIGIEGISQITKIEITPLHENLDTIIISEMVAEKEEIGIDLLLSVKEHVDYYVSQVLGNGILIGSVNVTAGDSTLNLSNPDYLDRYGVIKLVSGSRVEVHQIDLDDEMVFRLNDNFDGKTIINTMTADVYLYFPSYLNPGQNEICLPGIAIWGIEPDPVFRGGELDTQRDSFSVTGQSKERPNGKLFKYNILLDCEARSGELVEKMAKVVRRFIAHEALWINGRMHEIEFSGPAREIKPNSGIDFIPKVQYSFTVEVKENVFDRQAVPLTASVNTTIDVL